MNSVEIYIRISLLDENESIHGIYLGVTNEKKGKKIHKSYKMVAKQDKQESICSCHRWSCWLQDVNIWSMIHKQVKMIIFM